MALLITPTKLLRKVFMPEMETGSLNGHPVSLLMTDGISDNLKYIEVKSDHLQISREDDEVLLTRQLSACVAIGICHKFNPITQTFQERRLAHIVGGNLEINPRMTKLLFDNLHTDASFVISFGTLYEPNGIDDKNVMHAIHNYCKTNEIKFDSSKTQRVYTFYKSKFIGTDNEPGSVQLFSTGMLTALKLKEYSVEEMKRFMPVYPVPSIASFSF
jgi:hypothetical protein